MKKNLSYIKKNLSQTFGIKFDIIPQGTVAAMVYFNGNIDEERLNSDMQSTAPNSAILGLVLKMTVTISTSQYSLFKV